MSIKYKVVAFKVSKNEEVNNTGQIPLVDQGNRFQRLLQTCSVIDETVVISQVNHGHPVDIRLDLKRISKTIDSLLVGNSINETNRATLKLLAEKCHECQKMLDGGALRVSENSRNELLVEWLSVREWYFFTMQNQEYQSPSLQRENTVYQGGIFDLHPSIKYIRSEMGVQVFHGQEYNRDVVCIRKESSDSFIATAAKYVTYSPAKNVVKYNTSNGSLESFIQNDNSESLIEITIDSEEDLLQIMKEINKLASPESKVGFVGGIYIKTRFLVKDEYKQELQSAIHDSGRDMQFLVEEPYDPLSSGNIFFSKVSFIYNRKQSAILTKLTNENDLATIDTFCNELSNYSYKDGKLNVVGKISDEELIKLKKIFPKDITALDDLMRTSNSRRYQLLQDAASLSYRLSVSDVLEYIHQSNKINDYLRFESETTEDGIVSRNGRMQIVGAADRREMARDYQVLLDTIDNIESMFSVEPASDIDKQLLQEVLRKLSEVKSELMRALENQELQVTEASFTFHDSYYKLRTLVQYAARLIDNSNRVSFHEMNCQIGKREGSLALATNSGMAATRNVLMHLVGGSKVLPPAIRFYTAGNYWETEFLFENMDRNPHYNNLNDLSKKSRMTKFEANSPKEKIESYVEAVLEDNVNGAQMLCLDKSIAPFFYTETFDLLHFTKVLDKNKDRIHHPIYLVVDNTLDFDKITVNTLFPNGVPKNVFLIFTASMAKMHQLGLDTATGGVINIYSSVEDKPKAEALHAELEVKITSEGTAQTGYNRYLLDMLFFRRYDEGTMDKYLDYMVRKRQRNTEFFINGLELGLRDSLVGDSSKVGMYHYQSPLTGARKLQIRDDKDQTVMHEVDFSFHHDPESNIHAYFTMIENAANNHVAGRVFEEIKRRVFERAALRGIHLADGTSWGFPITRLDWYMHTMRIAMGLQHEQTMHSLGIIMSGVLNELFISPQDFLQRAEIMSLRGDVLEKRADELLELDRLIPHDPNNPTPISYYNEPRDGAIDFSFYVRKGDKMVGFVYAYATEENGEKFVYLSKAAVSAEHREDRYFRRMLMNLWINARQMGYKKILLQTSASSKNEGVIKAYERCGFKVARLVTEMQEDGWPLIMVEMEADVEGSPYEQMEHFPSIPNEVYEQIHDSGNLTLIDTYKPK